MYSYILIFNLDSQSRRNNEGRHNACGLVRALSLSFYLETQINRIFVDTITWLINTSGSLACTFLKGSSPEPSPSASVAPCSAEITGLRTAECQGKTDVPPRLPGFLAFIMFDAKDRGVLHTAMNSSSSSLGEKFSQ